MSTISTCSLTKIYSTELGLILLKIERKEGRWKGTQKQKIDKNKSKFY